MADPARDTAWIAASTDVWRGGQTLRDLPTLSTGHAALDRCLPGGGWSLGSITELLTSAPGSGELSVLLPVLAELTTTGQWVMMLDPPWVPYPPAMRGHGVALERLMLIRTRTADESLWACEQALRNVRGGAILAWHEAPAFARLRRLQLAARAGHKLAFLFRDMAAAGKASPAALRLKVDGDGNTTRVTVLKCRGQRPPQPVALRRSPLLPGACRLSPAREPGAAPVPETSIPSPEPVEYRVH